MAIEFYITKLIGYVIYINDKFIVSGFLKVLLLVVWERLKVIAADF